MDLKADRSIIILNIDDIIYDNGEDDIKSEIESKNTWAEILEVHKFGNSKSIKVMFSSNKVRETSVTRGLCMFGLSLPGTSFKRDAYFPVLCCYRCYKLECHTISNCPESTDYKICSICSSNDHVWTDCRSCNKKCPNCNGNHNAMSGLCPKRREIIKKQTLSAKPLNFILSRDLIRNPSYERQPQPQSRYSFKVVFLYSSGHV